MILLANPVGSCPVQPHCTTICDGDSLKDRLMSDDYQRNEIVTGTPRRRQWTGEQKLRIVEESHQSGEPSWFWWIIGGLGGFSLAGLWVRPGDGKSVLAH